MVVFLIYNTNMKIKKHEISYNTCRNAKQYRKTKRKPFRAVEKIDGGGGDQVDPQRTGTPRQDASRCWAGVATKYAAFYCNTPGSQEGAHS